MPVQQRDTGRREGAQAGRWTPTEPLSQLLALISDVAAGPARQRRDAARTEQGTASDELMELVSRQRFDVTLEREADRAHQSRVPTSLLVIDVDHFQEISTRHGRRAADRVLDEVGVCLRRGLRSDDTTSRYGGDEFAVILSGAVQAEALAVGERIRGVVLRLFEQRPPDGPHRVTISGGVSTLLEDAGGAAEAFTLAWHALERAKRLGGNRVLGAGTAGRLIE